MLLTFAALASQVVLDLGRTELSADEVNALVAEMAADESWSTADAYDIFVHNSNHFGVELAERLVKEPLPSTTFRCVLAAHAHARVAMVGEVVSTDWHLPSLPPPSLTPALPPNWLPPPTSHLLPSAPRLAPGSRHQPRARHLRESPRRPA